MEDPKQIEKLFEGADEKLSKAPRPKAWDRLNTKLEDHEQLHANDEKIKVITLYRRLANWRVAASLLLLVGLFTFAINQLPLQERRMVVADARIQLEDIPLEEPKSGFYALAVKCRQFYNTSPSRAAAESLVTSKLLPNKIKKVKPKPSRKIGNIAAVAPLNQTTDSPEVEATASAEVTPSLVLEEPTISEVEIEPSLADSKTISEPTVEEIPSVSLSDIEEAFMRGEAGVLGESVVNTQAPTSEKVIDAITLNEPTTGVAEDYSLNESESVRNTKKRKPTSKREKRKEEISVDAAVNVMTYEANNSSKIDPEDLVAFQWLIGSWTASTDHQEVVQHWQIKDEFTIEGNATFILNGQEADVKKMTIQKESDGIYLIFAKLDNGEVQRYRLNSMLANKAIFGRNDLEFVIEQLDSNQFMNFSNQRTSQSTLDGNLLQFNGLNFSRIKEKE